PAAGRATAIDPRRHGDRGRATGVDHHRGRHHPGSRGRGDLGQRDTQRLAGHLPDVPGDRRVPAHGGSGSMSTETTSVEQSSGTDDVKAIRRSEPRRGPGGGPMGGMGMPAEKSMNFGPSARRLIGRMAPYRVAVIAVILLGVSSVVLAVLGPKILGKATDLIFAGVVQQQLPAGQSQAQIIAQLRASGQDQTADLLSGMTLYPGQGMDFSGIARVLLIVLAVYVFSSILGWLQAYILNIVVQRTILRLRADVES